MKIDIAERAYLTKVPRDLAAEITKHLTVENPVYRDNAKMGRWNGDTPEFQYHYHNPAPGAFILPRGYTRRLIERSEKHNVHFTLVDHTRELPEVDFHFSGQLRDYQEETISTIKKRRFNVLEAPTGSGKTVIALAAIAERKQPALVIVHTSTLLSQWVDRIHSFLGIPVEQIGVIGGGKKVIGEKITVAMVQSLFKIARDVSQHIGFLIVDECHRTPSRTFTEAISAFDSKYMLGLSATPYRRDGLTKLINFYIGETAHRIDQKKLTDIGAILPFKVKVIRTQFDTDLDASEQYSRVLSDLTKDTDRNRLVASEAAGQAKSGKGIPLVLSDRKAHCRTIAETLERGHGITPLILTGDLSKKAREAVVQKLNAGDCKALVATGQLIGEGFDMPALGAVILATPQKFKGRVIQSIGRGLRPSPGQTHATIVDIVDSNIPVLKASAKSRMKTYRQMGGTCQ
jgi:superfamily II DNA or RNA helicase